MKAKPAQIPAVILCNPKYPHNVGGVLRACACFDVPQLLWTGSRVTLDTDSGTRLPREERMKGYRVVNFRASNVPFDLLPPGAIPVAVEVHESSENLTYFEHPEMAAYSELVSCRRCPSAKC